MKDAWWRVRQPVYALWVLDLNHVCRAFNEHTGVYVRFPPQEHVSETYDVCASHMLLYT